MQLKNQIPVLGLGTWRIGGHKGVNMDNDTHDIKGIKSNLDQGITLIDTAEVYGEGHSEELIGIAIKEYKREDLFIVSKVAKWNLKHDKVLKACKDSLKRLQTDYLDLYLIHAPDPEVPLEETMKALNQLKEQGLIKHIGVSNFNVEQMKEASTYGEIIANQIEYNLGIRNKGQFTDNMESEIIPYCQKSNIVVMAFRPFGRDLLWENETLKKLAEKYDKTIAQICIQWLISKKNIITIPKSTNPQHIKENLEALEFEISKEDTALLDELS